MQASDSDSAVASDKPSEAERVAQEVRRWARWARNQEMQKILLAAADWIEEQAKKK